MDKATSLTDSSSKTLSQTLSVVDPEIFAAIGQENKRQEEGIELIASENATSKAVMETQGSYLTNKYAEGYPRKRFYGGCEYVDIAEDLAIARAKALFGAKFANVQPHSGSNANMGVLLAELSPGDRILGMDLSEGGHLTHGSPANFSGKLFQAHFYGIDYESGLINYEKLAKQAEEVKPKMLIAGASAYSRIIDFAKFREIADSVGALLLVDMAHIAGLVAAGVHPSPVPHAHYVTTTTHKTLRGPRGGLVLTNDEARIKKVNSLIFPGIQGGPLMHVIAAKAVAFKLAKTDEFVNYQKKVVDNARSLASALHSHGFYVLSGGTDNHVLSLDLTRSGQAISNKEITGKALQIALDQALITLNKNMVPRDPRSPFVTSGVRIGTPTVTTRGMGEGEMETISAWIHRVASNIEDEKTIAEVRKKVIELTRMFPLY